MERGFFMSAYLIDFHYIERINSTKMKKTLKLLGILIGAVLLLLVAAIFYVSATFPKIDPAPELSVDSTPELVARGEYLANHVAVCMDCHSTRDWSRFSAPPVEGTLGMGGDVFDQKMGMPGVFNAKNITPTGINRYTDGELYRVITTGVTKENDVLFPIMPYPYYGKMAEEDVHAIIAYLRTLEPKDNDVPGSKADFPFSIILKTIPQEADPQPKPELSDQIAYGKYMTNMSGCVECHTPVSKGQIIPEMAFSGGREFMMPNGVLRTPNITPHETGIGSWTEATFIARFKTFEHGAPSVSPADMNTIMPWTMYAGMDTTDLQAIYAYLRQVEPMENEVTIFSPYQAESY